MKKIFTKQNIMPVAVLGAICIAVAALLAGINMLTSPIIEDAKNAAANAALLEVLPGAKDFKEIELTSEYPAEIKKAHSANIGYVFQIDVKGKDAMTVMVGVDKEGKITQIKILSEQETPGYKDMVFPNVTGDNGKFRKCKVVDPSFHNWFGLAMALRNEEISNFPICNKSFNLSYCGHDL